MCVCVFLRSLAAFGDRYLAHRIDCLHRSRTGSASCIPWVGRQRTMIIEGSRTRRWPRTSTRWASAVLRVYAAGHSEALARTVARRSSSAQRRRCRTAPGRRRMAERVAPSRRSRSMPHDFVRDRRPVLGLPRRRVAWIESTQVIIRSLAWRSKTSVEKGTLVVRRGRKGTGPSG